MLGSESLSHEGECHVTQTHLPIFHERLAMTFVQQQQQRYGDSDGQAKVRLRALNILTLQKGSAKGGCSA
jgi:hypothetical protein